jgi:hypothetical protein
MQSVNVGLCMRFFFVVVGMWMGLGALRPAECRRAASSLIPGDRHQRPGGIRRRHPKDRLPR